MSLDITPGFDGYYKVGSWLPLKVTIENRGLDWQGEIHVEFESAALAMPVTLPAPSRKSFFFELPGVPRRQVLEIGLRAAGRVSATAEARLQPLSARTPLFVVVTERAPATRPRPRPGGRLALVRARDLPERWKAYQAVDAVVVDAASAGELRPAQRRALSDWLLAGGRLVLRATEPARLRSALLSWSLTAPEGSGAEAGLPEEFPWGRGIVRLLKSSSEPLSVEGIRENLSGRPPIPVEPASRSLLLSSPPAAEIGPDSAVPLVVHFLVYFVAVVVAAIYLSRPPRHPLWSYAALVALATAQILSIDALGRIVTGGRILLSTRTLVHAFPHVEESFVAVRGDFSPPGKGNIRLTTRLRDASIEADGAEGAVTYRFDELGRATIEMPAALWRRGRIYAAGFAETGLRVETAAVESVRILNRSQLRLKACHFLGRNLVRRLPDLPPGESLELTAAAISRYPTENRSGDDVLLARMLSVYRTAGLPERAGEMIICSASGEFPGLASDLRLKEVGGAAVVLFHLPHGRRSPAPQR